MDLNKLKELRENIQDYEAIKQAPWTEEMEALKEKILGYEAFIRAAQDPNTPVEILRALPRDEHWEIKVFLSKNPSVPSDILKDIALKNREDNYSSIWMNLAQNPNTPTDVLEYILGISGEDYSSELASNPNISADMILLLLKEGFLEDYSLSAIAENEKVPEDCLRRLSQHSYTRIKESVASNKSTPIDVLTKLSKDEDYMVRAAVAGNENTHKEIQIVLRNDTNSWVADAIEKRKRKEIKEILKRKWRETHLLE